MPAPSSTSTRAHFASVLLLGFAALCSTAPPVFAQAAGPAPEAPPANPNPYFSAAAGSAPAQAAPNAATPAAATSDPSGGAAAAASAGAPADAGSSAATPAATPAPSPVQSPSPEALRLARERWKLQVMLARARAEAARRSSAPALAAETRPEPRVHGNAGAAFAIGASWQLPFYLDRSYDVFADKNVANRFGLWAAYDVASLRADTIAALELGWGTEHVSDSSLLGGALGSELTTHAFHGGVQLRWVPTSFLQPHLRLAGGAELVSMALHTSSPDQRFSDHGVSPFGSLGLGFTLRTPTRLFEDPHGNLASLSLGLMVEGGYTLAGSVSFTADGPGPGKRDIPLHDTALGKLDRSGPYARASFVVRF